MFSLVLFPTPLRARVYARHMASVDVAVIGAGVVGCAVARHLVAAGYSVVLLEAMSQPLCGASRGNSAMVHCGFDCTPGTLESVFVTRGHKLFRDFASACATRKVVLPWRPSGAIMLAMRPSDLTAITDSILPKARLNGVGSCRLLATRDAVVALEPNVSGNVVGGLHVPEEWSVDPFVLPMLWLAQACRLGATDSEDEKGRDMSVAFPQRKFQLRFQANVVGAERIDDSAGSGWRLTIRSRSSASDIDVDDAGERLFRSLSASSADRGAATVIAGSPSVRGDSSLQSTVRARLVINCAGLHGDKVDALLGAQGEQRGPAVVSGNVVDLATFRVVPRLGRFIAFDTAHSSLIRSHALLPLPTPKTKGIIVFKTVHGAVVSGPTAEDPDDVRPPQREIRSLLQQVAVEKVPKLASASIAWEYAGSRPATRTSSDYVLSQGLVVAAGCHAAAATARADATGWMTVAGVRSTGLTAAAALAESVAKAAGVFFAATPRMAVADLASNPVAGLPVDFDVLGAMPSDIRGRSAHPISAHAAVAKL